MWLLGYGVSDKRRGSSSRPSMATEASSEQPDVVGGGVEAKLATILPVDDVLSDTVVRVHRRPRHFFPRTMHGSARGTMQSFAERTIVHVVVCSSTRAVNPLCHDLPPDGLSSSPSRRFSSYRAPCFPSFHPPFPPSHPLSYTHTPSYTHAPPPPKSETAERGRRPWSRAPVVGGFS